MAVKYFIGANGATIGIDTEDTAKMSLAKLRIAQGQWKNAPTSTDDPDTDESEDTGSDTTEEPETISTETPEDPPKTPEDPPKTPEDTSDSAKTASKPRRR